MKFLILEDSAERIEWFLKRLFQHQVMICQTAEDAIRQLELETFDVIFLDHDLCNEHYKYVGVSLDENFEKFCKENLDATTGMAVARWLANNLGRSPNAQIVIHTMNTVAQGRMAQELIDRKPVPVVAGFDYLKRKGFKING